MLIYVSYFVCALGSSTQCYTTVPPIPPQTSITACEQQGMFYAPQWEKDHMFTAKVKKIRCSIGSRPTTQDAA